MEKLGRSLGIPALRGSLINYLSIEGRSLEARAEELRRKEEYVGGQSMCSVDDKYCLFQTIDTRRRYGTGLHNASRRPTPFSL